MKEVKGRRKTNEENLVSYIKYKSQFEIWYKCTESIIKYFRDLVGYGNGLP